MIKKGNYVEFTEEDHDYYEVGGPLALYGVALENEAFNGSVLVATKDGIKMANFIHAYGFIVLDDTELDEIAQKHRVYDYGCEDD
jgi:hypothetical protein